MRIIGGIYKGYRFNPPRNNPARPTTDVAKEGLFNILENNFDFSEIAALDLFGGTGSISFELASRGCTNITNVELYGKNVQFIKETAQKLDLPIVALKSDVFKFIAQCKQQFNFIFAGPPYPLPTLAKIPDIVMKADLLLPEGWFVLEHNPNHNFDAHPYFWQKRNYGTTIFSIFTPISH
ncbi:MAG: RsmD family RNA methyltransferase [Chitinophagales bacterium]|nr:RsmD family RNA methyltransferase [Bacteroidota bacterium]MCB9042259.1 RsmD family RNA methyltransferase [Chitinophagales bacterium]